MERVRANRLRELLGQWGLVMMADDADRQKRLDWLRRTVQTYGWRLHPFVLMTNHEHLFVETPSQPFGGHAVS